MTAFAMEPLCEQQITVVDLFYHKLILTPKLANTQHKCIKIQDKIKNSLIDVNLELSKLCAFQLPCNLH